MTCIVAVKGAGGVVFMGGDSAGVAGRDLTIRADKKVFRLGEFLIGYTSSFRMGQLLRYAFRPLAIEIGADLHRYMCTIFVDAVRQCLKDGGFATKSSDAEAGGCFLVALRGHIYQIDDDYQVGETTDTYDAVGCGASYAKGCLWAQPQSGDDGPWCMDHPNRAVMLALATAEHFSAGVRGPFTILRSDE